MRIPARSARRGRKELGLSPKFARLTRTDKTIPKRLLKNFSNIPKNASGDLFGQIYEYFLGKFAMAEGQKPLFCLAPSSSIEGLEIMEGLGYYRKWN